MSRATNIQGSKFVVDFGQLALPSEVGKQLEGDIRKLALSTLARIDFHGGIHIKGLPTGVYGYVMDPENGAGTDSGDGGFEFPAALASSKAAGVSAIRITRVKRDLRLEQLDAHKKTITGFVMHPLKDGKKVKSVAVTRLGSGKEGGQLSAHDRVALAVITDELAHLKATQGTVSPGGGGTPGVIYFWKGLVEAIGAGIACGLAGVEGGLNPLADADCAIAAGTMLGDDDDDDD